MLGTRVAVKRVLLGRPRASRELRHRLLPKWMALPVFSSDPLSSVAYATQEMMLVLALAGAGALVLVSPLSALVAILLAVVVAGYRQTVRAYPHGGGAYSAARQNLGDTPGLVAGAALLVDYALTVAVSIAAGVAAVTSAFPDLGEQRVPLALGILAAVTVANLRGLREGGTLSALPTYSFVIVMLALIVTGVARCGIGIGGCPAAPSAGTAVSTEQALTAFLVLRAFAFGAVALTGVEAVSNGVSSFRYPQSRNAAATLGMIGALSATLLLGVGYLAAATGVVAHQGLERTVVAEIALALFGEGAGFYLVQATTAAILLLAANSAYADFPRFASVLARDRWLPRQLLARGDRLVFTNGILVLGVAASALLVGAAAHVTALVPLYIVSVFTAFTLSQAGMARRSWSLRERGWRRSVTLNAIGTTVTGLVIVVVALTRLVDGTWVVVVGITALVLVMRAVHVHYRELSLRLRRDISDPPTPLATHAVVLLDRVDEAAARALSYVLSTRPASIRALGVPLPNADLERRWASLAPDVPLEILQPANAPRTADALVDALTDDARRHGAQAFTNAVIPETMSRSWVDQLREHRLALRLKAKLHRAGGLVVSDITSPVGGPGPYTLEEPAEHHVVVLVATVDVATLRALAYAKGLHATSVRALMVSLEPESSSRLLSQWADWDVPTPLEVVDSPFRSLSATVRTYVRGFAPDGRHTVVTMVLPTFVLEHPLQGLLHNQSGRFVKSALLFERGVVTTDVPYPLSGDLEPAGNETDQTSASGSHRSGAKTEPS